MSKLITVIGGTGAQGGSVVQALLDAGFKVRTVSRNVDSDASKALAAKGVEIVQGDIAAEGDLAPLFKDSYGAFLLTNFWDKSQMFKEFEQGKRLVDGAKAAGVTQVVWSTLANVAKHAGDKYNVPHFTDKAKEYLDSLQQGPSPAFKYATHFYAAFYYQNLKYFFPPKFEDGVWAFSLPTSQSITAYDVRDTGAYVAPIFQNPEKYNGQHVRAFGFDGKPSDLIDRLAKAAGVQYKFTEIPLDVYSGLFPGAHELADMFGWFNDFGYYGPEKDLTLAKETVPSPTTIEKFVQDGAIEFKA